MMIRPIPRTSARSRGQPVAPDDRRAALCPREPARARRDLARSVRRAARRGDGDAADLRARHPASSARGGLGMLRLAPAVGAVGMAIWFGRRPLKSNVGVKMLWAVAIFGLATVAFGFSRWLPLSLAVPGAARRGRHALGLCPPVADPALHARCDARPRRRGLDPVHLGLERAGRGRIGLPRRR